VSGAVKSSGAAGLRRFRPYPAYRDSGVEWLGQIPAHWEAKRLKLVATLNPPASEVRSLPAETEVSFVPMEAVGEYGGLDLSATKQLGDVGSGYTYFRDGDVVVAKITPCFENGKGAHASGLANGIAFGTTELHVLRVTHELDERFLFYLTLSDAFRRLGEADMYGAGGQKRISESFVENFRSPLPPMSEQRAFAAFLDRETAKIDALVAKKERVIELAPGEACRPDHPRRRQGPGCKRPYEGLRRRVARRNTRALGGRAATSPLTKVGSRSGCKSVAVCSP
jgi:type I restriction enzyme S subunit